MSSAGYPPVGKKNREKEISAPGVGKSVLVAVGGGISSLVSALILKEQGYRVVLFHLKTPKTLFEGAGAQCHLVRNLGLYPEREKFLQDFAQQNSFDIHYDEFGRRFMEQVVSGLVRDEVQGRNAFPCVDCHSENLFHHLDKKSQELKIDFISTGHFARLSDEPELGRCLWRGKEIENDQSAYLGNLKTALLKRTVLPLGHLKKAEVEKMAKEAGLTVHMRQLNEIENAACFSPQLARATLVERLADTVINGPGYVVDFEQRVLGEHPGIHHFELGSKEGMDPARAAAQNLNRPEAGTYVPLRKDATKQWIHAGPAAELKKRAVLTSPIKWIVPPDFRKKRLLKVQLAYKGTQIFDVEARLIADSQVQLELAAPNEAFEPKQGDLCAIYDGTLCLGLGRVLESYSK